MNRAAFLKVMAAGITGALVACAGDDPDPGGSTSAAGGSGSGNGSGGDGGNGSGGSGNGSGGSGNGSGGNGSGGMGTGGNNTGGGIAGACGGALTVLGSNYASDPHDLVIPLADLEAGELRTYTTTGNGHTHDVTLSEADFAALQRGETVKKYICYEAANFTDHEFVISCANPDIMPTFEGEIGTPGDCPAA